MTGVIKARSEDPFHYVLEMSILGIAELGFSRLAVGLVSPFNLIYIEAIFGRSHSKGPRV